ncbi:hypothetical protein [Fusobacterium sp. IOR10]|uniref:hypothetical protein n=1 Tax=Fusobacterium sp. IOR10 TaxID=2665157 RepID=UPI0013D447EB|nr:hypothetical protein [Fusobacterium sp. IOR10]
MIPLIDNILNMANKFIPDKNAKLEFEKEMKKLEIESLKGKGDYIEKINKTIPFVLPCFLLALLFMFFLVFLSDFFFSVLGKEAPIIPIDDRLIEFCKWFVAFLFSKKTISKFSKK